MSPLGYTSSSVWTNMNSCGSEMVRAATQAATTLCQMTGRSARDLSGCTNTWYRSMLIPVSRKVAEVKVTICRYTTILHVTAPRTHSPKAKNKISVVIVTKHTMRSPRAKLSRKRLTRFRRWRGQHVMTKISDVFPMIVRNIRKPSADTRTITT